MRIAAGVLLAALIVAAFWLGSKADRRVGIATQPPASQPTVATRKLASREEREQRRLAIRSAMQRRSASARDIAPAPSDPAVAGPIAAVGEPPAQLDAAYISQRIREDFLPVAKECYEDALARNPKLAGKLTMEFAIVGAPEEGGIIESSGVLAEQSTITDAGLQECMSESLYMLEFPPPADDGALTVHYPFVFAPD